MIYILFICVYVAILVIWPEDVSSFPFTPWVDTFWVYKENKARFLSLKIFPSG